MFYDTSGRDSNLHHLAISAECAPNYKLIAPIPKQN